MGLLDFLFGTKAKTEKLPTMNEGQMGLLQQLLDGLGVPTGQGLDYLSSILSNEPGAFDAFEAPFKTQFEQQTVPGIAEQFSALGAGSQGSSAFGQALGQAGANLQENLSAQRAQLRNQALGQLGQLLNQGLGQKTFGYQQTPAQGGFLQGLAPGIGSMFSPTLNSLGSGLSGFLGGGSFGKGYRGVA